MNDISIFQTDKGTTSHVALTGKMSEGASYAGIRTEGLTGMSVDFDGVTMINSKGVQIWKEFMLALPPSLEVTYTRCPLKIVNQLNLFPSFTGNKSVRIASFHVPYYCGTCDEARTVLLEPDLHKDAIKNGQPPGANCPECANAMEFDANPQKFFLFLRRAAGLR